MLLACLDNKQQPDTAFIQQAARLAEERDTELKVLCVMPPDALSRKNKAIDNLFSQCKQSNADMIIYFSDNQMDIVRSYIDDNPVDDVVVQSQGQKMRKFVRKIDKRINVWESDESLSAVQ